MHDKKKKKKKKGMKFEKRKKQVNAYGKADTERNREYKQDRGWGQTPYSKQVTYQDL